jgi:hypothetical protein
LKVILTVVALAVGGLIAGCGSSSSTSKSTTSSTTASAAAGGAPNAARRAALAACLKQHGVTLPARPPGAGSGQPPGSGSGTTPRGGFFGGGGGGRLANNPKLRAAFQACGARLGFGGGQRFRLSRAAITKYVTCVREHGYNLPNPNFSGKGPVFPSNIRANAKFQAASRACQSLLAPPQPAGATSTTSGA